MVRIVHRVVGGPDHLVEVEVTDPTRPVAELAAALVGEPTAAPPGLIVDGRWMPPLTSIDQLDIRTGSVVRVSPTPPIHSTEERSRAIAVVGGLRAGITCSLGTRAVVVGRDADADLRLEDPAVSGRHLEVDGDEFRDLGGRNGLVVAGSRATAARHERGVVGRIGASTIEVVPNTDDCPHAVRAGFGAGAGRVPFNRPPRPRPVVTGPAVAVPAAAPPEPTVEPPSIAGIVLPVIAGGVMAWLFSPFMAVFTALGPVLTIGTWWERRRRARRSRKRALVEIEEQVALLVGALPSLEAIERERRRYLIPDPAEVVRRAQVRSARLWERRPEDPDCGLVGLGTAALPLDPVLAVGGDAEPAPDAVEAIGARPPLFDTPVVAQLRAGDVIGVVGPADATRAIGRALLLQMAIHHGPADLAVVVAADSRSHEEWGWTRWLPHTTDPTSGGMGALVGGRDEVVLAERASAADGDRLVLAVLDGDGAFQGRGTVGRRVLAGERATAVVMVEDPHRLPAGCTTLVEVDGLGRITVCDPRATGPVVRGLAWGLDYQAAGDAARRLAQLDDPEFVVAGAGLPDGVPLLGLLGLDSIDGAGLQRRWDRVAGTADLAVPIGADADGPVEIDLVADGPHVLVGGTTGSGKSELLRSLVAGLAASADPNHVALVLIDYKGGAAFDCCGDLPHVAGVVTDLDAALASRALRCLEAELRYREERLRAVGADNLADFRRLTVDADAEPIPRLVVVIDEFASMAADLPDFVDALVGIAQRGRSLGVHLVLATQRPAGVVTDDIRANTGCRIALRVTDAGDSTDVIGSPDAADIPRTRPGRAIARLGPGELTSFQSALVTGHSRGQGPIRVRGVGEADLAGRDGPTDLARLVAAICRAHGDRSLPRTPWPDPLPESVAAPDTDKWFLVDDPDRQAQRWEGWSPSDGHLVVLAGPGAGATTTLQQAAAVALAGGCHVHGIDFDAGGLEALGDRAGVGAVATPSETERRVRLLRRLVDEIDARRAGLGDGPRVVLVVDDLGGLGRSHDSIRDPKPHEHFARIWSDGPAVGVSVVVSIRRAADLPPALAAGAEHVLVHRTLDPTDATRFGVCLTDGAMPAGRAVRATDGALLHVAIGSPSDDHVATGPPPFEIGELATEVLACALGPAEIGADGLHVPFGVRDSDLDDAVATFRSGDHFLILGPARSGRTTTLVTLGAQLAIDRSVDVLTIGSGLAARLGTPDVAAAAVERIDPARPTVVLIDDAADVADPLGRLALLVADRHSGVHLVAAERADRVRNAYGHWIGELRSTGFGLLLRPDPLDGDLLGAALPGRLDLARVPGRGLLVVDGMVETVQVARTAD